MPASNEGEGSAFSEPLSKPESELATGSTGSDTDALAQHPRSRSAGCSHGDRHLDATGGRRREEGTGAPGRLLMVRVHSTPR
jgi:hypothetical protein